MRVLEKVILPGDDKTILSKLLEPLKERGKKGLKDYCLSKEEVDNFVEKNPKYLLRKGTATIFLIEIGGEIFALLFHPLPHDPKKLHKHVRELDSDDLSHAKRKHRIIVPWMDPDLYFEKKLEKNERSKNFIEPIEELQDGEKPCFKIPEEMQSCYTAAILAERMAIRIAKKFAGKSVSRTKEEFDFRGNQITSLIIFRNRCLGVMFYYAKARFLQNNKDVKENDLFFSVRKGNFFVRTKELEHVPGFVFATK